LQISPADISEILAWEILGATLSGKTVDGYVSGATVFADANGNGSLDPGEVSTTTDQNGNFTLPVDSGPLVAFGGTDISTGLPFNGQLSAPAGYYVVTPLTTLVDDLTARGASSPEQSVLTEFGLSPTLDLSTLDPIAAALAGDAVGAAAEVAGAEVYDTVSLIASALAGAGGTFSTGGRDTFAAIATAINNGGIDLTNQTALTGLIANVVQTEQIRLGQGVAGDVAAIIAASNAALVQRGQADASGTQLLSDTAAIELVTQGAASNAVQQAGNDPTALQSVVATFTGTNLTSLTTEALNQLGSADQDSGEQAALKLTVNGNSATPIGSARAGTVAFTVAGLDLEDTGTVTFIDVNGKSVQVYINGGQTSYTANLISLADGAILSSLAVNTDPAGNSFTPVAGNSVSLDQDVGEQPTVTINGGNSTTPIGLAGAETVALAVGGLDTDDSGTLTFSDNSNSVTATISNGQVVAGAQNTATAIDLSSLTDDKTITSSLSVSDAAGNTFTANGHTVMLDQDVGEQAALKLTVGATAINAATASAVPVTIAGLDSEDTGTVSFTDVNGKSVQVYINGGQTSYSANLTSLADGPIAASLAVNTDAAGNSFKAVAGNGVSVDQDSGEQAALKLTVNGGNPIGAAIANAVPFTASGFEADDNGTVAFGDGTHAPVVVNITNGVLSATTANLSGLNDGTIAATLHLKNVVAGNSFTDVVTTATLDQDKVAEPPTVTAPSALTIPAGGSVPLGVIIGSVDSDDVLSVTIKGVPGFESVTAPGDSPIVTTQLGLYTYTFNGLPPSDWNNGLILHSTYPGNGHPTNPLSIVVSNTTTGESSSARAKTISVTDPPAASGRKGLATNDLLSSSQQTNLLWTGKLHEEMVAGLHDALALTNNDTPLLYDSHDVLFRQAMASFGANDLSTAHDSWIPTQYHGGFHELAASDTHTLALTRAASSADTILAMPPCFGAI
jgi:hypothetical protein